MWRRKFLLSDGIRRGFMKQGHGESFDHEKSISVTKSGVWLLATQMPIKRPGWRKGKFALFWMLATGCGVDACPKADSPPLTIHGLKGLHAETAQSL